MADKLITDLQLRDDVNADVNFPVQDPVQSYRVTAPQIKNYVLAPGNVGTTELADSAVTFAKLSAQIQAALIPVGSILPYAGSSVPTGFLFCEGQAVSRTTYSSLFAALGISHGQGDGSTTFNLPDYRGRFLRGVDGSAGIDPDKASRTAMNTGGNTGNNVGSVQSDALQGHRHASITNNLGGGAFGLSGITANALNGSGSSSQNLPNTSNPLSDTVNGTPRFTSETRPINAYVNYIIKT